MGSKLATRRAAASVRKVDGIVFDLVLLAFVGTLVAVALVSLDPGARLVPLIIGVPTVIGLAIQLVLDLFPGLRRRPLRRPAEGEEAEEAADHAPQRGKRELVFAAWIVGFVALTAVAGMLVSVPIALFFFFRVLGREGWVLSLLLTAGAWIFLYGLFGVVLGVPF
ncbi:MAG: hypothetical protein GEV03_25760 [Streptosporangiales bacterium]|nr:hypothetical protein [Streptosporangiales bacterium]